MSISEPDLTISFHPDLPDEVAARCPTCLAKRGVPCARADQKVESHVDRRAAWLMELGREHSEGYESYELWNKVLHVIEELPEADQLRWKRDHLNELKRLAFGALEESP